MTLGGDPGNLTEAAQAALNLELLRRGLVLPEREAAAAETHPDRADGFGVGVPGFFPGAGPAVEQALEPAGEVRAGMVGLISLYDGLELSSACKALEDADVEPAIEEIAGDPTIGTATRYEIWVAAGALEQAKRALRARMGLFPEAEVGGEGAVETAGDGVVGQFESDREATEVQTLLADAGVPAALEHEGEGAGEVWLVRVDPADHERALGLLAEDLGIS